MAKMTNKALQSVTMVFLGQYTGKPIGGNRTFTAENILGPFGFRGYAHNRFRLSGKTLEGKACRPKEVKVENGVLYAV